MRSTQSIIGLANQSEDSHTPWTFLQPPRLGLFSSLHKAILSWGLAYWHNFQILGYWLIPIITWCWPFPFILTNILRIKSKLKLESRAIAIGVAMSLRNLGGKYHCRPQPWTQKFTGQFFCRKQSVLFELHQLSGVIAWQTWQHRWSCGVFKSFISVAHCHFQWKWRVLHIWYISVPEQVGMSFNGIAHLMKV